MSETPDLLNPDDPWYSQPRSLEEQREAVRAWNKGRREAEKQSGSAAGQQMALQDTVSGMSTFEKTGYFMEGINIAKRAYDRLELEANTAALNYFASGEEKFDAESALQQNKDKIHPSLWNRAASSDTSAEFEAVMKLSQDQEYARSVMSEAGQQGDLLPAVLASVVDADIALAFLSGGSYLGPKLASGVSRVALHRSPRLASIAYGAGAGLEVAAIGELGNRALGMGYEAQDLPTVLGAGLVFGTGIGAMTRMERFATLQTREKLAAQKLKRAGFTRVDPAPSPSAVQQAEVLAANRAPKVDAQGTPVPKTDAEGFNPGIVVDESAGAARVGATFSRKYSSATENISKNSELELEKLGYEFDGTPKKGETKYQRAIDATEDFLNTLPWLRTDMDVMMKSKSPTAVLMALNLMESASGRHRLGRMSAAVEKQVFESQLSNNIAVQPQALKGWLKANGMKNNRDTRARFNRAVADEMDNRYYGGTRGTDEHINLIADAIDHDFQTAAKLLTERGVAGAENLQWRSGWMPQRWSGENMQDMIALGVSYEQIERGLINAYKAAHPTWSAKALRATAKAVIQRMHTLADGVDTNIYRVLQQDGRAALGELYMRNGMTKAEWEQFADLLELGATERGKAKILKSRNEIDLRTQIPGTEFTVRDLLNNDLMRTNSQYARQAAGHAALAGAGIRSRADWDEMWKAIEDEVAVNNGKLTGLSTGKFTENDSEFKNYLWDAMTGGAVNRRVNGMLRRMVQTSNLSLLNQMGFTQAAETATLVAANGFEAFIDYLASKNIDFKNPAVRKAVAGQLQEIGSPIQGMHNLHRQDLHLDEFPKSQADLNRLRGRDRDIDLFVERHFSDGGTLDELLGQGGRLQGFLSGFYLVRHAQHMAHDQTFVHMLGRHISGKNKISANRLRDLGFTPEIMEKLRKDWQNVKYEGRVISDLGIDKWSPDSIQAVRNIMTRSRLQNVQEGLFGEGMFWMHKDVGAIMGNLRSFTLLALKKQTLRHARIADSRSVAMVTYGVPFAGLVSWARDTANGREDKYDPVRIMNRAWNYAGVTAPLPLVADPFMGIIGMDDWQFGMGAREYDGPFQVVPGVASFETMNKLGRIPASAWNLAFGDAKPSDVSQMQAIPLIGNAIGFNAMFNSVKQDIALERAERKKQERAEAKAAKAAEKQAEKQAEKKAQQPVKKQNEDKKTEKAETVNPLNTLEKL